MTTIQTTLAGPGGLCIQVSPSVVRRGSYNVALSGPDRFQIERVVERLMEAQNGVGFIPVIRAGNKYFTMGRVS